MKDIILVGYGGHAKSVVDCIERGKEYRIIGYTDNKEQDSAYKYLGTDVVLKEYFDKGVKNAVVCIGYMGKGSLRQKLYEELKSIGYELPVICDPSSIVSESAQIGEGTFIGKGAIINAEAKIGRMVIVNTMSLIEHECIVEDFTHIAVSAVLCGQVQVGKAAFVGANATVIQGRKIKDCQFIQAGEIIR